MTFKKLSEKQKKIFKWCYGDKYKAIICDGAVRSGKTICMITSFVLWAMRNFNATTFGICGKTVQSAERNIIMPLQNIIDITAYFKISYTRSSHMLTIEGNGHKNYFYIFGGKDESSYMLIQGITLSGVFFDEVALMPQSFVNQAIARTLSVEQAKLWFNCNPDNPQHWFYKEWILQSNTKNALHLHFLMSDNPTLSKKQIEQAKQMYSSVFKKRYIEGLWIAAEGIIYRQFADNTEQFLIDTIPNDILFCTLGMDFGGNGSAHAIVLTGYTSGFKKVIILDEYYRKEVISPSELENDVCNFIKKCQSKYKVHDIYCDSAEQVLIKGIRTATLKNKILIDIHNAKKGAITSRIRFYDRLMSQGRFFVHKNCKNLILALQSAVWDSKSLKDVRLDDGNYNIDSLDAMEYSTETYMNDIFEVRI